MASPGPVAHSEGDTFWSFIVMGAQASRHKDFRMIMVAMAAAAVPYALADDEVLLDFAIPPWFLGHVRAVAQVKGFPLDDVVLRPSEASCAARAAARADGTIADDAPYHALYTSFDDVERHIVADDESAAPSSPRASGRA